MALPDNLGSLTLSEAIAEHRARDLEIARLNGEKLAIKRRIEQLEAGIVPESSAGPTQTLAPLGAVGNLKPGVPGE